MSDDDLGNYGRGGRAAADAAAAKVIANYWKTWRAMLGTTGKVALNSFATFRMADAIVTKLPLPLEFKVPIKIAVTAIPAIWELVTNKEWREAVGKVCKDTVTIAKHYAKKLSETVCEVAKKVKASVTRTLTTVGEKVHHVYETAKTKVQDVVKRGKARVISYVKAWFGR